jgi:hypothetical protein
MSPLSKSSFADSQRIVFGILVRGGPGSSVGIATDYGPDGPGNESQWGARFSAVQIGPGAHPDSCTMGTGSFPGVKCGRGVTLNTHPLLVPRSWKSRATSLPTLWAATGHVTGTLYSHIVKILKLAHLKESKRPLRGCQWISYRVYGE